MRGNSDNKVAIARAGGIAPLIMLLREGTPYARQLAEGAVLEIARDARRRHASERRLPMFGSARRLRIKTTIRPPSAFQKHHSSSSFW